MKSVLKKAGIIVLIVAMIGLFVILPAMTAGM